jgi:hypothetical protein
MSDASDQGDDLRRRGTRAHAPDPSWSEVRETVLMLELASGQIEAAMRDSNASVEVLTQSFTCMADTMRLIRDTLADLPGPATAGVTTDTTHAGLLAAADNVSGMVHQAIIAFQFYDKLVQRLGHVTHSLGDLSELVSDQQRIDDPRQWVVLQERIRAKYTTPDEHTMFEAVMRGMPVADAIAHYVETMKAKHSDDIELF